MPSLAVLAMPLFSGTHLYRGRQVEGHRSTLMGRLAWFDGAGLSALAFGFSADIALGYASGAWLGQLMSHGYYYTMNRIPAGKRVNQTAWLGRKIPDWLAMAIIGFIRGTLVFCNSGLWQHPYLLLAPLMMAVLTPLCYEVAWYRQYDTATTPPTNDGGAIALAEFLLGLGYFATLMALF